CGQEATLEDSPTPRRALPGAGEQASSRADDDRRSSGPAVLPSRRLIDWCGIARGVAQNLALAVPVVRGWAASRHTLRGEDEGGVDAYQSYRSHTDVAGKAILELGPGRRLDVLRAARRDGARRCVAVDVVPYRDAEPGIEYRVYDGRSLPFGDAEFDV